jgi:hypothetical protein
MIDSVSHTLIILGLLKEKKFDEVFDYIKKNNIDPQMDDNIISDYAAIWVDDENLVKFFKRIKKIGGEPTGHRSIVNNTSRYGKIKSLKYLIAEGALKRDDSEVVYAINTAVMDNQLESIKLLRKHIDVTKYPLLAESNPSIINRIVDYPSKKIFNYLFNEKIIQPYIFTTEFVQHLENLKAQKDEEKKIYHDYKNYIIKKVLKHVGLENKNKYISQEEYKPGDIYSIFKTIEYDSLNKELTTNAKKSKIVKL